MIIKHVGKSPHRLTPEAGNPLEVAFAESWEEDNADIPLWYNGGHGTLELLMHSNGDWRVTGDLTQDEATAAATVIQWLGSPVGFSFVRDTLEKCGYEVVAKGKR